MEKKYKFPKTLGACADKLYTLKQKRKEEQKKVDEIHAEEKALEAYLIDTLPKSEAEGVMGHKAKIKILTQDTPIVKDWNAFWAYVSKTKSYDMVQKRLNPRAIQDRLDDGKNIKGLGTFTVVKVSCTKA